MVVDSASAPHPAADLPPNLLALPDCIGINRKHLTADYTSCPCRAAGC